MYTPKRTPRKRTGSSPKYVYASPYATRLSARRRLTYTPNVQAVTRRPKKLTKATRIGYSPGTATDLRRITVDNWDTTSGTVNSKTLVTNELTNLPRKTSVELNGRERDMVNCLGFTIRVCIRSGSSTFASCIRMAVVSPIDSETVDATEFFRGYGNKRGEAFTSLLDSSQLLFNPINRDTNVVLWEKAFTIGPATDTGTQQNFTRTHDGFLTMQTYIKLNRQLRYDNAAGDSCTDKLYLCFWYDNPNGNGLAAPPSFLEYKRFGVMHWKDPSN